jgi:hypothetical protein
MAITRVQYATKTGASVTSQSIILFPVTSGNTLIAAHYGASGTNLTSVTDNQGNAWIQAGQTYSYPASTGVGGVELWYARGVKGGATSVTFTYGSSASVYAVVNELAGAYYVDPLDCWSQTDSLTTAAPSGNTVFSSASVDPRVAGEYLISAVLAQTNNVATSAVVGASVSGASVLATTGSSASVGTWNGLYSTALFGYGTQSASTQATPVWNITTSSTNTVHYAGVNAMLRPGNTGLNPRLQFPETLVQISPTNGYASALNNNGYWVNISSYVLSMTLGPNGRQHELGRIQSTQANIKVDNRDGTFNPWNTLSFLYYANPAYSASLPPTAAPNFGLQPMNPIQVTAAWNGQTYPKYLGYMQSITPNITNVLDVDADIVANDILQMHSLKYLAYDAYGDLIRADGGSNLGALYELNDPVGSYSATNSGPNGGNGSLLTGSAGVADYGAQPLFLYQTNTTADLTSGSKAPNAGVTTTNFLTSPPTLTEPLSGASVWTFECWWAWNSASIPNGTTIPNAVMMHANNSSASQIEIQVGATPYVYSAGFFANTGYAFNTITVGNATAAWAIAQSPTSLFSGQSHHLVVNVNHNAAGSGAGASVWVDGSLLPTAQPNYYFSASVASQTTAPTNPTNITFGSPPTPATGINILNYGLGLAGQPAPVLMSNVAFYNGMNLTPTQVISHYNEGILFQYQQYGAANGDVNAARLNALLTVVGQDPARVLKVPYPFRTLLYGETQSLSTTSGLNYLQTLAASEPGIIFQGPDGYIYAYNRQYQYLNPTTVTSQGIFADAASVTYHYDGPSLKIAADDLDVWNQVQVKSGKGGAALQEVNSKNSISASVSSALYGSRTLQGMTSLQQQNDSDALALAQYYIYTYDVPRIRVTDMSTTAQANSGLNIPKMLGLGLLDRITVQYTGQTNTSTFSQDSVIEGITDTVDMSGPTWQTTWNLSPYEILMSATILGTYTFGATVGQTGYGQLTM